ncbi:hypothetical protein [Allomuricauda sp. CP2A]|jgi:hypothetical protein|uniref:Pepco domain-containing protein n=1 Tax=Allomuricauda sp. CP2A TaxID=1848189 RepID=UPI00082F91E5|nr:hypothetical protein [Muricauda sp. CP2A]
MAKDNIIIFSKEEKLIARGSGSSRIEQIIENTISVEVLSNQIQNIQNQILELLDFQIDASKNYQLEEVEISAEVSADGKIGILGVGTQVGAKGGIVFKFKRKPDKS